MNWPALAQLAWQSGGRSALLDALANTHQPFDIIIIGGGITGAATLDLARRRGYRCLLVEQRDFAWGSSSRSSKMVHGGLRYLARGGFHLAWQSLHARQDLLRDYPGLVKPLPFIYPHYPGMFPGPRVFQMVLAVYDAIAGIHQHARLPAAQGELKVPGIRQTDLRGLSTFSDATTDDARLVMRFLHDARRQGAPSANYLRADALLTRQGATRGIRATDTARQNGHSLEIQARMVINASGAWADKLAPANCRPPRLRPLRGSHLILPESRLPVACAVTVPHPQDHRRVYVYPWEGVTLIGTTDVDHADPLSAEPCITAAEADYLLQAANWLFPSAAISAADVISSFSGVRPIVTHGRHRKATTESRAHAIWQAPGYLGVSGGKLTTSRLIAAQLMARCRHLAPSDTRPLCNPGKPRDPRLHESRWLASRYGANYTAKEDLLTQCGEDHAALALHTALADEAVTHLDDLLLRRTRLGLLHGANLDLQTLAPLCQRYLHWDDSRFKAECARYQALWQHAYAPPDVQPAEPGSGI